MNNNFYGYHLVLVDIILDECPNVTLKVLLNNFTLQQS